MKGTNTDDERTRNHRTKNNNFNARNTRQHHLLPTTSTSARASLMPSNPPERSSGGATINSHTHNFQIARALTFQLYRSSILHIYIAFMQRAKSIILNNNACFSKLNNVYSINSSCNKGELTKTVRLFNFVLHLNVDFSYTLQLSMYSLDIWRKETKQLH